MGQTEKQMNGMYSIIGGEIDSNDATKWMIKGNFSNTQNEYKATDVAVGDEFLNVDGITYEITKIYSVSGSLLIVQADALNNTSSVTQGVAIIYRPTSHDYSLATSGVSDATLATSLNSTTLKINSDLPLYSSGTSLPTSSYSSGDIISVSGTYYQLDGSEWTELSTSPSVVFSSDISTVSVQSKGSMVSLFFSGKCYYSDGTQWIEIPTVSSLPEMSTYGDVFCNTTDSTLYMMSDASKWLQISGGGSSVSTGTSFPSSADVGDFFYNTNENILYFYDVNNEWEEVSLDGSTPTGILNPTTGTSGHLFFNTSENQLYVYNGAAWIPVGNDLDEGHIFVGNSTDVAVSVEMSGDATIDNTGKLTIEDDAVTDVKLDKANIPLSGFGDAKADVSMGNGTKNYKITNLKTPTSDNDAANKAYVDVLFANPDSYLSLKSDYMFVGNSNNKAKGVLQSSIALSSFGVPVSDLSMNGLRLINVATPTDADDAVNKDYVDNKNINPINIVLPFDMMLLGNATNHAGAVNKIDIPFSDFGVATQDVEMGDGTTNYRIINLADPTDKQDAVTKVYVDDKIIEPGKISLKEGAFLIGDTSNMAKVVVKDSIPLSGFAAATENVDLGGNKLINVALPEDSTDVVNKKYVDSLLANPDVSLALPTDKLFIGNGAGKAGAVDKTTIPLSDWGMAETNIALGDAVTQYQINYLADPVVSTDAATKNYVDQETATSSNLDLADSKILVGGVSGKAKEVAVSGDATLSNMGALTITDDAVTAAKINADVAGTGLTQNTTGALDVDASAIVGGTLSSTDLDVTGGSNATLADVSLSIADDAVTAAKINADIAGTGLTQNTTGALEVDASAIAGGTISSTDLDVTGGANATFADVSLSIADSAITNAKLDKANIPISGFGAATADIEMGDSTNVYRILNLKTPGKNDAASTAATKGYVDNAIASLKVPGNLYQGTVADAAGFLALTWSTVSAANNLGLLTAIPQKVCDLSQSGYTWIAYPAAWDLPDFFYQYDSETYAVFDGFQKRIIPSASTGTVDYQVWVFKTTPDRTVSLITQN